jgi:hypothetical protein
MIQLAVTIEAIERAPRFWKGVFLRAHAADIGLAVVAPRLPAEAYALRPEDWGATAAEMAAASSARLEGWDFPPTKVIVAGTGGAEAAALAMGPAVTWWVREGMTTEGIARIAADMLSHGTREVFVRGPELVVLDHWPLGTVCLRATAQPGERAADLVTRLEEALAGQAPPPAKVVRAEAPPRLPFYAWAELRPWLRQRAPEVLEELEALLVTRGVLAGSPPSPKGLPGMMSIHLPTAPISDDACAWLVRALGSNQPWFWFGDK